MEPNYVPDYPADQAVDAGLKEFVSRFYQVSDQVGRDEEWVDCFEDNATVVMGSKKGEGRDAIAAVRAGMWEQVAGRRHTVRRAFPASFPGSDGAVELMLFGLVEYSLKTGEEKAVDWAGHAVLKRNGAGAWRFEYYRVYLQT